MTVAYWCVLVMIFLPIVFAGLAKSAGRYDNAQPRLWLEQLDGWQLRSHWAQLNTFEAFAPFAAAVLIAHQVGAAQGIVDLLAVLFVVFRVGYGAAYIAGRANLRSLLWMGAFGCVVGLFVVAAFA